MGGPGKTVPCVGQISGIRRKQVRQLPHQPLWLNRRCVGKIFVLLVQGEVPTVMEGDWQPQRVVVIEFPSRESAQTFLQDPDAQSLFALRHNTATSKLILVDGCL